MAKSTLVRVSTGTYREKRLASSTSDSCFSYNAEEYTITLFGDNHFYDVNLPVELIDRLIEARMHQKYSF